MRPLFCIFLCLNLAPAFADQEGQTRASARTFVSGEGESSNLTEAGFTFSSLNQGASFATIGLLHEFSNGIGLGARGFLPLDFARPSQAFMGQAVARFMLLNETNQMFIDATLTQGVFNESWGTQLFAAFGAEYGYMRKINRDVSVGAKIGADYSAQRVSRNLVLYDTSSLYSKISLVSTYYF